MNSQVGKSILIGVLAGAAFFVMPFFILQMVIFFMILNLLFRVSGWGRRRGMHRFGPAFADRIRAMNDDEYAAFKQQFGRGCRKEKDSESIQHSVNQ
jgi:hypothetical protein